MPTLSIDNHSLQHPSILNAHITASLPAVFFNLLILIIISGLRKTMPEVFA